MQGMGAMGHGGGAPPPMGDMGHGDGTMGGMNMGKGGHWTHMTFFQGKNAEVLFKGWPGRNNGGMYALALIVVFILGVIVEWVASWRLARSGRSRAANGLLQTAAYALKVGFAYLLMLAVMSFNVGVLLVAIGGHALGFFLFNSALRRNLQDDVNAAADAKGCAC